MLVVFEGLLGAKEVEGHPILMFAAGFLYSFISVYIALLINPAASSMLAVGFTALASMPLLLRVVEFETKLLELYPKNIVGREEKIVVLYLWFMLGLIVGYTLAFSLLPDELYVLVTKYQHVDLGAVARVRISISGRIVNPDAFSVIFSHNLLVFSIGVLLSFIYGTGGAFLLSWNASVLSTVLADSIRSENSVFGALYRFCSMIPHGILEFSAYFVGSFLGALISLALLGEWKKELVIDLIVLFLTGILLLALGAAVEASFI